MGPVRRRLAGLLDRLIGLELLREMAEFFQAFAPLYDGFRRRAREVQALLRRPETRFLLVAGPGESRVPDVLFFARRLRQAGHHLAAIVVNQVHASRTGAPGDGRSRGADGVELLRWLGDRDARGLTALRQLVTDGTPVADLPLLAEPPAGLAALEGLGRLARERFTGSPAPARRRRGRRRAPA
jgi:anion-transporting  ArsA/GET3 family ATPase